MYKFVPTQLHLYREGDNAIFGESVTTLRLDDEAGGVFLTIAQDESDFGPGGELRFDFDEIDSLFAAIQQLKDTADMLEREEKSKEFPYNE